MNTQEEKPNIPMKQSKTVLHHYLGTGLKMISESGTKLTLHGLHDLSDDTINYILENEVLNSRYVELKPALHSMNRLTMPLENGEIPLLECAKIAFPNKNWEIHGNSAKTKGDWSDYFRYTNDRFLYNGLDNNYIPNEIQLFQYLIKNHFNVFSLPESEYIEKSTLNTNHSQKEYN